MLRMGGFSVFCTIPQSSGHDLNEVLAGIIFSCVTEHGAVALSTLSEKKAHERSVPKTTLLSD